MLHVLCENTEHARSGAAGDARQKEWYTELPEQVVSGAAALEAASGNVGELRESRQEYRKNL